MLCPRLYTNSASLRLHLCVYFFRLHRGKFSLKQLLTKLTYFGTTLTQSREDAETQKHVTSHKKASPAQKSQRRMGVFNVKEIVAYKSMLKLDSNSASMSVS